MFITIHQQWKKVLENILKTHIMFYDYLWETKAHLCLKGGRLFHQMMGVFYQVCRTLGTWRGSRDTSYVRHCSLSWPSGNRVYPLELGVQQRQAAAMPGEHKRSLGASLSQLTSSVTVGTACNQDSWIVWISGLRLWLWEEMRLEVGLVQRNKCWIWKTAPWAELTLYLV